MDSGANTFVPVEAIPKMDSGANTFVPVEVIPKMDSGANTFVPIEAIPKMNSGANTFVPIEIIPKMDSGVNSFVPPKVIPKIDSPAKLSTEEYNYYLNQLKMQETGRNVKCVISTCASMFWTDGPFKQHLTKYHKKSKKEIKEICKRNSFEERKEISEKQERRKDIVKDLEANKENQQKTERIPFGCIFCGKKFLDKVSLGKHIQNDCKNEKVNDISKENRQKVSEPINTTFGCMFCDSKFINKVALTEHDQNECRTKKLKSKENRSLKLMRLNQYENNTQKEPDPFETTICKFCNSNFPNKVSLREHVQFDCKKKCPFCDTIFWSKDLLKHVSDGCDGTKKNMKRNFPDQDLKDAQEHTLLLPIKKPKIQEDRNILLEVHEEKNYEKVLEGNNKPTFDRELCSKSFAKEWILDRHNSASHKLRADLTVHEEYTPIEACEEKNHEKGNEKTASDCRICNKSFSKEWMLIKHCAIYHTPSKERVPEEKKQARALKPIQTINKRDLHCFECDLQFDSLNVFKMHESVVHQDFPVVEKSTAESVDKTRKNVNKEDKFHNILDSKNQKTVHEVHEEEKQFLCAICAEAFKKESSLNGPFKLMPLGRVNEYKCNLCAYSAKYVKIVQERKKEHNCGECNAKFLEERDLNEHVLVVHDRKKEFKCFACGSCFKEENELNIHTHQSHRVIKQYKCNIDFCTAKFPRKLSLELHIQKIHHGATKNQSEAKIVTNCEIGSLKCLACEENNRPYKCHLCSNRYSHQESLTKHVDEVHCNVEKLYMCEICNMYFSQEQSLTYHFQTIHNDETDDIIRNLQNLAEIPQTSAPRSLKVS